MAAFRILSLDGGGSWALIQVRALMAIYGRDASGHDVLRHFDLAAANSGGTIVLGGLIADMPLSEILEFFESEKRRRQIFVYVKPLGWCFSTTQYFGPRYVAAAKLEGLRHNLGRIGDTSVSSLSAEIAKHPRGPKTRFVFCAFDYDQNRETFFRSDTGSLAGAFAAHQEVTLAQAIHASSNAPVLYFNKPAMLTPNRYWDGAIGGYNNPALCAAIEAAANAERYGTSLPEICLLSIGTGTTAPPIVHDILPENAGLVHKRKRQCLGTDIAKMASAVLDDPPDVASFHAHMLLGCRLPLTHDAVEADERVVRMNPVVRPIPTALPVTDRTIWTPPDGVSADDLERLYNTQMDATSQTAIDRISDYCQKWLDAPDRPGSVPNQPVRQNPRTMRAEIGHDTFAAARKAWLALDPR